MLILRPAQQEAIQQALPLFQRLVLHPGIDEHMPELAQLLAKYGVRDSTSQNKMLTTAVEWYQRRMLETALKLGIDPG